MEGSVDSVTIQVPSFIAKLWYMLHDPNYGSIIAWSLSGESFVIKDKKRFTLELLPHYFKHNNLSSFTRQLNKYGFRKVPKDPKVKNSELEFSHCCFMKDEPNLLIEITRQQEVVKESNPNETLEDLLNTVQHLRKKQEMFESKVGTMEKQQELLCRETSELKKKQLAQLNIINNIMAFLAKLVKKNEKNPNMQSLEYQNSQTHTNRSIMAISQSPVCKAGTDAEFVSKTKSNLQSVEDQASEIIDFGLENSVLKRDTLSPEVTNSVNALEHKLLEDCGYLDDEVELMNDDENIDQLYELQLDIGDKSKLDCNESTVEPTVKSSSEINIGDLDIGKLILLNTNATCEDPDFSPNIETFSPVDISNTIAPNDTQIVRSNSENDLNDHVNSMESDINDLKEILSDSSLNLDVNEVLELFTPDGLISISETEEDLSD